MSDAIPVEDAATIFTNLIPTTPLQWGVTAVVASFILLGVGASISLRKEPRNVT